MLKINPSQTEFVDFYLPFSGKVDASNRWVKPAKAMLWEEVERCYAEGFAGIGMGAPAKSGRIAFGALVIKEQLGISDEETVEQILENPYLQYFLGLKEFSQTALFDPSMMVHFRNRFSEDHHRRINEKVIAMASKSEAEPKPEAEPTSDPSDQEPPKNSGKLLVDATCTPADIAYPTDLNLLKQAREKTEQIIDCFHDQLKQRMEQAPKKQRTYRNKARKDLALAKQKSSSKKKLRKAISMQLRYLKRNLGHIKTMIENHKGLLCALMDYHYRSLLVINTLYDQQHEMYTKDTHTVKDRIVSISQPHVRLIVRGKADNKVEFEAKVSVSSQKEGYMSLDKLSCNAHNEGSNLVDQIESYHRRFGYYSGSVHADQIHRTRENRGYRKEKGIRLSSKPLDRPKKPTQANLEELKAKKAQRYQDELDRILIEGKFGNVKRKGSLGRVMTKLRQTSESVIHVGILVLNLQTWLRKSLLYLCFAALELLESLLDQFNKLKNGCVDSKYRVLTDSETSTQNRLVGQLKIFSGNSIYLK